MEDSSTNPYIPGGSQQLQRKVERPQTTFARLSKLTLIISGALLVLLIVGLVFVFQNTSKVDEKARGALAAALQPTDQLSKLVTVKSELGFTVSYQDQLFKGYGELGASRISSRTASETQAVSQTYENNDLKTERDYGLVRVTPLESSELARAAVTVPPELEVNGYDKNLLLQTDEQKAAEAESAGEGEAVKGTLAVSTFVAVDTKKRLGERTSDDGTIVSIEATKPIRQEIEGVEYQKVRYTTRNENYQVPTEKYDDCYYTIQNEQPYSACVTNVRPNNVSVAALLEDTIRLISYHAPAEPAKAGETPAKSDESDEEQSGDGETEQVVIVPSYMKDEKILKSFAKNQPNVMRIGTLYCSNLDLKRADGTAGITLTDACATKAVSGVFVSKTGHIATAGHAVRYNPKDAINGYINLAESQGEMQDRLQRVLDYLLETGLILETSAEYLETGAATGNQDALAKIENIASIIPSDYVQAKDENYSYAIQLTDKPIVLNRATGNKPSFAYSDSVVKAEFVKSDYDPLKFTREQFETKHTANDAALLKLDGTFPVATIAAGDGIGSNQKLVALGYPALADATLTADKILNMPVATTSTVNQTFDLEGRKIINSNTPAQPGNDGAPVFDEAAGLIGFAAYGPAYCPDRQCFGSGTIRSSNDLSALIDKHNIELENKSVISDVWASGVDAYFVGNYQTAASKFTEAGRLYGFNQWAAKLAEVSKAQQGSASDTSLMNTLASVGVGGAIFVALLMVVTGILLLVHLKRLDMLQVGHYGAAPVPSPLPQATFSPPQPMAPVPQQPYGTQPQQQWPSTPPVAGQQPPYPSQPQQPMAPQQPSAPPVQSQDSPRSPQDPFYRQQ